MCPFLGIKYTWFPVLAPGLGSALQAWAPARHSPPLQGDAPFCVGPSAAGLIWPWVPYISQNPLKTTSRNAFIPRMLWLECIWSIPPRNDPFTAQPEQPKGSRVVSSCYHNQVVWCKMWLRSESIMFLAMQGNCYYQEENAGSNSVGFSPLEL